jgi:hypothetical protein
LIINGAGEGNRTLVTDISYVIDNKQLANIDDFGLVV